MSVSSLFSTLLLLEKKGFFFSFVIYWTSASRVETLYCLKNIDKVNLPKPRTSTPMFCRDQHCPTNCCKMDKQIEHFSWSDRFISCDRQRNKSDVCKLSKFFFSPSLFPSHSCLSPFFSPEQSSSGKKSNSCYSNRKNVQPTNLFEG